MRTITLNGVEYVAKEDVNIQAEKWDDMEYCIVRTYSAGVFAGYVESRTGTESVIRDARRIWKWEGACSLSELAVYGTCKPDECKFAVPVNKIIVTETIEILICTERAMESITSVKEWRSENE